MCSVVTGVQTCALPISLGISAVLLSINDHLAAARPTSVSEASYSTEMRPTNWKAIGGFGALALVAIAISAYFGSAKETRNNKNERKSVVKGESVSVCVDQASGRSVKKIHIELL